MTTGQDPKQPPRPPSKPQVPEQGQAPTRKRKLKTMKAKPETVKPDKPKRKPAAKRQRTKVDGWQKGIVRTACFYVRDSFHQAVNVAAPALKVSKGVLVERAVLAYLRTAPELEAFRPALAAIIGKDWDGKVKGEADGEA